MAYKFPRERKRLATINGIFDDFKDDVFSETRWFETFTGSQIAWDVVAAPGGAGGNALWIKGTIADSLTNLDGMGHLSPYPNISEQYYYCLNKPFRWKMKAEYRMYIVQDQGDGANQRLSHAAGFIIDGAVKWTTAHNNLRSGVFFSVANQRIGLATIDNGSTVEKNSVAWAGAYDTYYDIRIEWEYDWFYWDKWTDTDWGNNLPLSWGTNDEKMRYLVKVYVNNSLVLDSFIYMPDVRAVTASPTYTSQMLGLGRCGLGVNVENDDTGDVSNGSFVEVYYKDVFITMDVKVIEWEFENTIISKGINKVAKGQLVSTYPEMVAEGADFQLWARNSFSDDWTGQFRGIIRKPKRITRKLATFEAEGYDSIVSSERCENLSYTTQTAQFIINAVVNNPETKYIFDTSTYFDTSTNTYTRTYLRNNKMDVIAEMAARENFILFIDMGNNFHHEEINNDDAYKPIHLGFGINRIIDYSEEEVFIRAPSKIRIIGDGVEVERSLASQGFANLTDITREYIRYDLTTEAECLDALEYRIAAFREPLHLLEIEAVNNWDVEIGRQVRVSIPDLALNYANYLVIKNKAKSATGTSVVSLAKVSPDIAQLLSHLNVKQEDYDVESYGQETPANEIFIEGTASYYISARFQIIEADINVNYPDTPDLRDLVVREGNMVITEQFLDDLNDLVVTESPGSQPDHYRSIQIGTGITPASETDTALETNVYQLAMAGNRMNNDGARNWQSPTVGTGENATSEGHIRHPTGYTSEQTISEIGIFATTSSSSKMAARATFPPYTPKEGAKLDFLVSITMTPHPSSCFPTLAWSNNFLVWLMGVSLGQPIINHISFVGNNSFSIPNPSQYWQSEDGSKLVIMPGEKDSVTVTTTQLKSQHMVKYEQDWTVDYSDRWDPADGDMPIAWIGACYDDGSSGHTFTSFVSFIILYYRTQKLLSDIDGYDTKIIIYLKFLRGENETENINNLVLPREYGTRDYYEIPAY